MATVVINGTACQDCVMIVANDDDSGISDPQAHRAKMVAFSERMTGHDVTLSLVVACNGEGDHEDFSTAPCDVCGTTDAGDRCPVAWIG